MNKIPDIGEFVRLICYISIKRKQDWRLPERAILDTGAPISLIPFKFWKNSDVIIQAKHTLRGIIPKKGCEMTVNVGWIKGILFDLYGNISDELHFRAYLAPINTVPLIIGFKELLDRSRVHYNSEDEAGYIEILKNN